MRDVLWTASCLGPVADFGDDGESVVIEAAPAGFSVADIDSLELAQYDDLDDPDESNDTADVNGCKMLGEMMMHEQNQLQCDHSNINVHDHTTQGLCKDNNAN